MTVKDQCFVCDAPTFFQDWPDEYWGDPFYDLPNTWALPASQAALPPYGLSRCASQAQPAPANAQVRA